MQFVKNGPNVPDKLLQAHEEGKVVFFCGAGISFPAKLPGFGGLVYNLYDAMGVTPNAVQRQALEAGQFDTAVSLLEAVKPTSEWRLDVRTQLAHQLTPDLTSPKATQTHQALIDLSKTSDSKTHLITTNFDKIFQTVIEDKGYNIKTYKAPLLPVPKNRWDGLVYLHGLLPENADKNELDQLVISSGDFGLAYLYERWAARFISELFRTYTVCFVGYSLNDPVLRYMMDALAADRLLGESPPEMYAFGSYKKGTEEQEKEQWLAKNVTPILYKMHSNHFYLHQTLLKWSELYRDGLGGKEQIVVTHALTNPSAQDIQFDYVKQMVWSLSDPSGLPAKRFANLEPSPSLDWLFAIDAVEMKKQDLIRFGVLDDGFSEKIKFNLFRRPSKSSLSPYMGLAHNISHEPQWDRVMENMSRWLINHLNNPELVLFLLKSGGTISSQFAREIEKTIEIQTLRRTQNDYAYFEYLEQKSPNAVLSSEMITVWNLALAGYCSRLGFQYSFYSWIDKYKYSGMNTSLRKELKAMLSPIVQFKKPFSFREFDSSNGQKKLLHWDIELSGDGVQSALHELRAIPSWSYDCQMLLEDFSLLLEEIMSVMSELGDVEEKNDYIFITHPSIEEHPQNRGYSGWTALIDLCRDSWISLHENNASMAQSVAINWWKKPFPIFKRLALFSAAKLEDIPTSIVINWFNEDSSHWLWETSTQREICQLLKAIPPKMSVPEFEHLLKMIIAGPDRDLYRESLTDEEFETIYDHSVWLLLAKIKQSGRELTEKTDNLFESIKQRHDGWHISEDEKEEFSIWMSNGEEPDYESAVSTPESLTDLVIWLKSKSKQLPDDWAERCRKDYGTTSAALLELSKDGIWPIQRWKDAINAWSLSEDISLEAWQKISQLVFDLPDKKLLDLAWLVAKWISKLINIGEVTKESLFKFYDRLAWLPYDESSNNVLSDPLTTAINHPVGIMTEALFNWWYSLKPLDDDGLESDFQQLLNRILHTTDNSSFNAQTIIFTNTLSLYRVDPAWTKEKVLPYFKWNSCFASTAWKAFLWSPRIHKGFLACIKHDLLDCAVHYEELGEVNEQYARFLTYVALQQHEEFKVTELAVAFSHMPAKALLHVASALNETLSSSGRKIEEYWKHRVKLFIQRVWPKNTVLNEQTVHKLVIICIEADDFFEDAYNVLKHYIVQTNGNEYVVQKLSQTSILQRFPETGLSLLNSLIGEPIFRPARKLEESLQQISTANPSLTSSAAYTRLSNIVAIHRV
ncbi:anti-phage defense-associated sirtuin Dsr1 [Vibrio splendidus]